MAFYKRHKKNDKYMEKKGPGRGTVCDGFYGSAGLGGWIWSGEVDRAKMS